MAFKEMSGPPAVALWWLIGRLAFAIIVITSDGCCVRRAGAVNNRSSGRRNATSKPLKTGTRGAGLLSKKSPRGGTDHRLDRRSRVLSAADGSAHVGSTREDARAASPTDARPPLSHQRHYPRWAAVPASASSLLRCRRSGGLPTCALAQDPRETPRHLGWFADPSRRRDQRVSQTGGVGQCLLCQSGSPLYCAHSSERALAAQARGHSQLFATMWLFGLVS